MGIKYFFSWLRKSFSHHIKTININTNIKDDHKIDIDNFLVDMNGIFHYCCQKVYKYGSFKENRLLPIKKTSSLQKQKELFNMIGNYITKLITLVNPNKRVVLAIDGVCPVSKINQQRQRRFRSSLDFDDGSFDSCCITPGTKFMDNLSKYIDWYIKKEMSYNHSISNLEIIFSSEKCPGEGEHKLVKYVRDHGDKKESYMIHGMDADLFMLSLATHFPNFHILRENPYKYENEYYYIDVSSIRENIVNALLCEQSLLEDCIHINDFILMIFLSGNDFLPHIPTIEILDGGVDNLFETYRNVVKSHDSLTNGVNKLNIKALQSFLGTLGCFEKQYLEEKRTKSIKYPDTLLEKYTKFDTTSNEGKFILDFEGYKKEYYQKKMNINSEQELKDACVKYIEGLQWVLTYYLEGVPNWKWFYPYYYAPFLSDIVKYMEDYDKPSYNRKSQPYHPFMHLLCVLPLKSKNLLIEPLSDILTLKHIEKFYPEDFTIDYDGKHNEWEGVANIPFPDYNLIEKEYIKAIDKVDQSDKKRNICGSSFIYSYDSNSNYTYKSYYGDIKNCKSNSSVFRI
jgi:5'-3' exonuclease